MEKKKYYVVLLLCIPFTNLFGQSSFSDRQKENIKGDVSCFTEMREWVVEEWGEEKYERDTLRRIFFNTKGNYEIQQFHEGSGAEYVTKFFNNDDSGRVSFVEYWEVMNTLYSDTGGSVIGHGSFSIPLAFKGRFQGRDSYEYDDNGRLKTISWANDMYNFRGNGASDERFESSAVKDVYVYKQDGYSIVICDRNGRTISKKEFSDNGRKMTQGAFTYIYDDDGHLLSYGGTIVAANGAASGWEYYGYNNNGDLAIVTSRAEAIKEIDIAPWLANDYKYSGELVYEYEYDDQGNWIRRKEYKTTPRGKSLEKTLFRQYEYGKYDIDKGNRSNETTQLIDEAIDYYNKAVEDNDLDALYKASENAQKVLDMHNYEDEGLAHYILGLIWLSPISLYLNEEGFDNYLYSCCCIATEHLEKATKMLSEDYQEQIKIAREHFEAIMALPIMRREYESEYFHHSETPESATYSHSFKCGDNVISDSALGRVK